MSPKSITTRVLILGAALFAENDRTPDSLNEDLPRKVQSQESAPEVDETKKKVEEALGRLIEGVREQNLEQQKEDKFSDLANRLNPRLYSDGYDFKVVTKEGETGLKSSHLIYTTSNGIQMMALSLADPENLKNLPPDTTGAIAPVILESFVRTDSGWYRCDTRVEFANSEDELIELAEGQADELEPPSDSDTETD